jgi:hypothetical protein
MDSEWPGDMTEAEEHQWRATMAYREARVNAVNWLSFLRSWKTKADLTFRSLAAPERAEKAVRGWLRLVAPGAWAVVGYERQARGAVHAHLVLDQEIDWSSSKRLWERGNGLCRIAPIKSTTRSVDYLLTVKHAAKELDVDVFGPGGERGVYSTGGQLSSSAIGSAARQRAKPEGKPKRRCKREGAASARARRNANADAQLTLAEQGSTIVLPR